MKLKIEIDCDNAAFADSLFDEIRSTLKSVAASIEQGKRTGNIRDTNGNTVGTFKLV